MDRPCDTPAQGLIGLIGYSYQQVATSFPEAGLQRTPRLSVLGPEKFGDGWLTGKFFPGAHEWGQSVQKRLVLVCEDSLCPRKQPDVSGPGLGEAGRYTLGQGEARGVRWWARRQVAPVAPRRKGFPRIQVTVDAIIYQNKKISECDKELHWCIWPFSFIWVSLMTQFFFLFVNCKQFHSL